MPDALGGYAVFLSIVCLQHVQALVCVCVCVYI